MSIDIKISQKAQFPGGGYYESINNWTNLAENAVPFFEINLANMFEAAKMWSRNDRADDDVVLTLAATVNGKDYPSTSLIIDAVDYTKWQRLAGKLSDTLITIGELQAEIKSRKKKGKK